MEKITSHQLDSLVARLNHLCRMPTHSYSMVDGKSVANVGNFHLSSAYGGVALVQMVGSSGGISMPLMQGHTTKRDCYDQVYAFIKGIEYQQHLSTKLSGE